MCYKENKHQYINIKMEEKLKNVPNFISDFFDRYKSATTKNCNWGYIRDLLEWLISKGYIEQQNVCDITIDDMDKVTSNHIIKYLNELKLGTYKRKNSLESINTKKNVFSSLWNYMFLNKYVNDNIIRHIPAHLYKSEITQKEVFVPKDEQIDNFLTNIKECKYNQNEFVVSRNLAIVNLIMGSGIRSEELLNLDMNDLHIDDKNPYIMVLGKGKMEQYDKVYISRSAIKSLQDYLKQRDVFVTENKIDDNAVFLSNDKRRISKTSITSFFNRYSDGTIFPHSLRHWVGTKLYNSTKDIVLVQKQLRHKNLETAARYYVHIDEDNIIDAVSVL